jgi:hypothetical protein
MNTFGSDPNDTSIRRGTEAALTGVRTALSQQQAPSLLAAALEPFLTQPQSDAPAESLFQEPVQLTWQTPLEDDEAEEGAGVTEGAAEGHLIVTHQACLFIGTTADHDWYVPAVCLALHALQQDDDTGDDATAAPTAVYIQLDPDGDDDNGGLPWEWTLRTAQAPALFAALSRLVSLHPVDPHEDTNHLDNDDDDDKDPFAPEDMIWASDVRQQQQGDDGAATAQDRQAMLERLDQVLVIPPEYEIGNGQPDADGQFDDADEEDEDDAIL